MINYDVAKLYVGVMGQFHLLLTFVVDEDEYSVESSDRIFGKLSWELFRDMMGHRQIQSEETTVLESSNSW